MNPKAVWTCFLGKKAVKLPWLHLHIGLSLCVPGEQIKRLIGALFYLKDMGMCGIKEVRNDRKGQWKTICLLGLLSGVHFWGWLSSWVIKVSSSPLPCPLQTVELYFYLQFSTFSNMYDSVQYRKYVFQIYMYFLYIYLFHLASLACLS